MMSKELEDFLDGLRKYCIENPITKEDLKDVIEVSTGFWTGKKQNRSRIYTILCPDGTVETTNCLQEFCRQHGLDQGNMCNVANGKGKSHKGYKVSYHGGTYPL